MASGSVSMLALADKLRAGECDLDSIFAHYHTVDAVSVKVQIDIAGPDVIARDGGQTDESS